MRTAKRYTTQTFTHRVDHEGGRHRPPRAGSEPAICAVCGAVYMHRRWSRAHAARVAAAKAGDDLIVRICAGCRQRKNGLPHGYVHITGDFVKSHREEIEHLLRNEAAQAIEDNPLSQIMDWEEDEDGSGGLIISTTTEHLAQRLGHALQKSFDGDVNYGFSHENKLAHVWWRR